jgi:hypothetical protein
MSAQLRERAASLAAQVRDYAKELDSARRALEVLASEDGWRDAGRRGKCVKALHACASHEPPDLRAFLAPLEDAVAGFLADRRRSFLDELIATAKAQNLACTMLGQQPPVVDLAGIQAEVDFDRESVELSYAREPLARVGFDAMAVLQERAARAAELAAVWPGAEVLFEALESAWRARLGREGKAPGERVHLVDLLPELVIEYERRGLRQSGTLSRAGLAFCLDRLARDGALERAGRRLELSTATGGSTKDKKRVLFLTAGMGGGQYYLAVRFVQAAGSGVVP